jgi:glucose/arabinose dehydrogenase
MDGKPALNHQLGKNKLVNKFDAYGVRNSFGFEFDPVTGNLWDTEKWS